MLSDQSAVKASRLLPACHVTRAPQNGTTSFLLLDNAIAANVSTDACPAVQKFSIDRVTKSAAIFDKTKLL